MADVQQLHPQLAALIGTTLSGRYHVDELIGVGGMSAVFMAHHLTLGRELAIKALHPQYSLNPEVARRFDREARVAAALEHPNCCRVTDFGTAETGVKFMVMPMLRGRDLRDYLTAPLDAREAVALTMQMLRGLKHAHAMGVVHRDLKPENLILVRNHDGETRLKITDFGITKIIRGAGSGECLTTVGMIPGTPEYMSPEHARGLELDGRSDLYSVGLILFEMLTGFKAFAHRNPREIMRMQVFNPAPRLPASVKAPTALRDVIDRLLAKDVDDRFFDAMGVLQALEPIAADLNPERNEDDMLVPRASWMRRVLTWFSGREAAASSQ